MRRVVDEKESQLRASYRKFKTDTTFFRWRASEAIYKYVSLRHVAGRIACITKICPVSQLTRFLNARFTDVINNRIIRRSPIERIARYFVWYNVFRSNRALLFWCTTRERNEERKGEREREEARSHFTEHEPRLYSRNNANVIVNYEHLKYTGVRGEERRDEWRGNRKNREGS